MKKKKVAAATAGAMTAAAIAVASVGGLSPTIDQAPIVEEDTRGESTFAGSMNAIEEAVNDLVEKSIERGMDIAAPSKGYTPGINGVITGMDGMAPTSGTTRYMKVSKEGSLCAGDSLKVCKEFSVYGDMRFATGGVKIIATASEVNKGYGPWIQSLPTVIAILYTQNGNTMFKTAHIRGDKISLGTTVTVIEGEALTAAAMEIDGYGNCYIAYNRDGDGLITKVKCDTNKRVNTVSFTEIWMDGGDPENICMATMDGYSPTNSITICCTRLPETSIEDADRYATLVDMTDDNGAVTLRPEVPLTPEAQPVLKYIDYSVDSYAQGWDIAVAGDYWLDSLTTRVKPTSAYPDKQDGDVDGNMTYKDGYPPYALLITYPTTTEDKRGLISVERSIDGVLNVRYCALSPVWGSVPSANMVSMDTGPSLGQVAITAMGHGVTRLTTANVPKSFFALEVYAMSRAESQPVQMVAEATDAKFSTGISRACVGPLRKGSMTFGFAYENAMFAGIADIRPGFSRIVMGPLVNVGTFAEYAMLMPVDETYAAYIFQTAAGDGYIRLIRADEVVAETTADKADGTALQAGNTGAVIRADIVYSPPEGEVEILSDDGEAGE